MFPEDSSLSAMVPTETMNMIFQKILTSSQFFLVIIVNFHRCVF